jgi:uncharacterized protein YjbI with pentapeptide repeats
LKGAKFLDIKFSYCEFENTYLEDTFFEKVLFKDSTDFSFNYGSFISYRSPYRRTDPQEFLDAISKRENPTKIKNTTFKKCGVKGGNFIGLEMKEVVFDECYIGTVFFSYSNLSNSKFRKCETEDLDFRGANLRGAVFEECDLTGIILFDADIRGVDFSTSEIHSNKFKGAKYNKDTKFPSWVEEMLKKDNDFELIFIED